MQYPSVSRLYLNCISHIPPYPSYPAISRGQAPNRCPETCKDWGGVRYIGYILQKFVTACPKTKAHAKRVGRVAHDHSRPVEIARWTRQSDSKVRCSSLLCDGEVLFLRGGPPQAPPEATTPPEAEKNWGLLRVFEAILHISPHAP